MFFHFINPSTVFNVKFAYINDDYFVIKLRSFALLEQISVHPLLFNWMDNVYVKIYYSLPRAEIVRMLKIQVNN